MTRMDARGTRTHGWTASAAAVAAALILGSAGTSPVEARTIGPACLGWTILPTPNPDGSANLVDVVSLPGGTAWAVGFSLPDLGFDTVALHYDGSAWQRVPTPDPDPSSNRLDAVDGLAGDDVWAAGSGLDSTLIEHWDGTGWSAVPSPNIPGRLNNLQGIAETNPDDAWAVGSAQSFDALSVVPVIERWDGSSWSLIGNVPSAGDYNYLSDVDATSSSDAWAVGSFFRASGWHNLVLHWDGVAWSQVDAPSPGLEDNNLEAVIALGADDAWAVGDAADSGVSSRQPVVLHWDGSAWSLVPSPELSGQLNSIAAGPDGRLWAAGYREVPPLTLIERWDRARWKVLRSDNRQGAIDNALFGIAVGADPGSAWAVGSTAVTQSRLQTLVEHPCTA
jgi:hypothetical protein